MKSKVKKIYKTMAREDLTFAIYDMMSNRFVYGGSFGKEEFDQWGNNNWIWEDWFDIIWMENK